MRNALFLLAIALLTIGTFGQDTTQGTLYAVDKKGTELGACPLKNTAVRADISGFLARVHVRQEFENSFSGPIEAVYTFPLSQNGAVDDMTMTIGSRIVSGKIMKREEARQVYDSAKAAGQAAALLDQERPNIFIQAVANIMPGEKVVIEISYVETLKYEDGAYEFVFPMTVGPRYIPASVKDANKIKPPVVEKTRAGHDISVEVNLNAGVPVEWIRSASHRIDQLNIASSKAKVSLYGEKVIPNKDFILRYDVTGKRLQDGVLAHRDKRGGFFTLVLQPPDTVASEDRTPKEIVFVLDTSGSMDGFPIEKAKEAMKLSLEGLYPEDTFNLITFAGDTHVLFDKPVPATQANLERAQAFLDTREGGGGTEMMKAIKAALDPSDSQEHLRIVCFMTDAFVGNDDEIISEIQKHPKARVFSFGIGSSVNRSLLDKMAEAGNGEVEYVGLDDDGSKAAKRFYERVRTPMLTDLSIDWNGLPVADVYPSKIGDLFSAKPVIVNARYTKGASGTIKLKGNVAGQPYVRSIILDLPETETANDVLATLWARRRVDELSMEALKAGANVEAVNKVIEGIGLEFRILTSFTSFVAVEEQVVNTSGTPTRVEVPVAVPEGVNNAMADDEDPTPVNQGDLPIGPPDPKLTRLNSPGLVLPPPSTNGTRTTRQWGDPSSKTMAGGSGGGMGTGIGTGTGTGRGTGSGSGSGSGSGTGSGSGGGGTASQVPAVSQTVDVTVSAEVVTVDAMSTSVQSTITSQQVQSLPKGTNYSSLLRLAPGLTSSGGGFQIDGSSGSENVFVIDGTEVLAKRKSGSADVVEGNTLAGRAVAVAEPVYPAHAKAKKVLGKVEVAVKTDLTGTIVSAKAVSGNLLLRSAAETAAMLSKFAPAHVKGRAVKISGTIVYSFVSPDEVTITLEKMKALPPTAEEIRANGASEKLHFWLFRAATRNRNTAPSANESLFVKNGKAGVRIVLETGSPATIEKLKSTGLELESVRNATTIYGLVEVGKLVDLAKVEKVTYISPKY